MRVSKTVFLCACLVVLTQLVWSQNKGIGAFQEDGIPGFLNPHTGKFTTRAQESGVKAHPQLSGTSLFFREQFNITITNYDQPSSALVVCEASISTYDDANGEFDDDATVTATLSGNTWTCDVPVLTLWTLQTPNSDSLNACVYVTVIEPFSVGSVSQAVNVRDSDQPCQTLGVPANGQTVVNSLTFQL